MSYDDLKTSSVEANYDWKLAAQHGRSLTAAGVSNKSANDKEEQKRYTFGTVPEYNGDIMGTGNSVTSTGYLAAEGAVTTDGAQSVNGDSAKVESGTMKPMQLVVDKERYKQIKTQTALNKKMIEKRADMKETVVATYQLPPLGRIDLFPQLDKVVVLKDQLFSGIVDFTTSGPVWTKVMMVPHDMPALNAAITAQDLEMDDVALRGTYFGAQRRLMLFQPYDTSLGPVSIMVANDREDPFVAGVDEMSNNQPVTNRGNYGVSYHIAFPTIGVEDFAVYFNPLGGAYSGALRLTYGDQTDIYKVPNTTQPYLGNGTIYDTQYLDTFKGGQTLHIEFMPAGASNLPVQFLLVPLKHKN